MAKKEATEQLMKREQLIQEAFLKLDHSLLDSMISAEQAAYPGRSQVGMTTWADKLSARIETAAKKLNQRGQILGKFVYRILSELQTRIPDDKRFRTPVITGYLSEKGAPRFGIIWSNAQLGIEEVHIIPSFGMYLVPPFVYNHEEINRDEVLDQLASRLAQSFPVWAPLVAIDALTEEDDVSDSEDEEEEDGDAEPEEEPLFERD
jgi:hypothetical protein